MMFSCVLTCSYSINEYDDDGRPKPITVHVITLQNLLGLLLSIAHCPVSGAQLGVHHLRSFFLWEDVAIVSTLQPLLLKLLTLDSFGFCPSILPYKDFAYVFRAFRMSTTTRSVYKFCSRYDVNCNLPVQCRRNVLHQCQSEHGTAVTYKRIHER